MQQDSVLIVTEPQLTSFEHILLGLICVSPSSGYDLKRIFAATPMGIYQPSSGALYPALRRLEQKNLIRAQTPADQPGHADQIGHAHQIDQAEPGQAGPSARHRRAYELTQAGHAAHASWLRAPVEPATVGRDLGLHLMRFVMMEHLFEPEEVLGFLRSLRDALAVLTSQLEQYTAASDGLGDRHPRLALDHGLAVHRASLQWTERTIAALDPAGAHPAPRLS
jgi:DNA-binding PadR family transcriptional regulator